MDKQSLDHLVQVLSHESVLEEERIKGKFQQFAMCPNPPECHNGSDFKPLRMIAYDDM